jgi:cell division protein FtsQ
MSAYRRRRRVGVGALIVLLIVGGLFGGRVLLLKSSWFRVAQIEIQSPAGVDPASVRTAAGIPIGAPLLSVDLDAVRRAVATVPPVASVTASRAWPHTVRLIVTERTPVALTASVTGPWLVDATGLAYQPAPSASSALPVLTADRVAPNDPATHAALVVLASLTQPVRQKLQVMQADGPDAVTLRLAGGKQVLWGSPEDSVHKARVLEALLSQTGSYYDVSAPDLPTLRR